MFLSLLIIITATFFLMKAIPGDPFTQEKDMPPEIYESMMAHYGLDKPTYVQYFNYLKSVATWELGPSFKYKTQTVNDIINSGFPVSLALGLQALLLALSLGVLLGAVAAMHHNKWQDYTAMIIAVIGISVPSFLLASFFQYIFAMKLGWLPVARWGTFEHSILPVLSLAALPIAFIARLMRSSMLEVLQQDYIKTAKSKGLTGRVITMRHALRNAILPVVTFLGPLTAGILTGSFVIEKIFGIPGLGMHFVTSISNRDYTVIMGITVFYSIILLLMVLLVDIAYGLIDPRIKLSSGKEN